MAEKEKNSDSLAARGGLNDAERSKKKSGSVGGDCAPSQGSASVWSQTQGNGSDIDWMNHGGTGPRERPLGRGRTRRGSLLQASL